MLRFSAETFVTIGTLLQCLKEEMGLPPTGDAAFNFGARDTVSLNEQKARKVSDALQFIENQCLKVSLRTSANIVSQTRRDFLAAQKLPKMYAVGRIAGIEGAIRVEMQNNVFLFVPPERSEKYLSPLKDWEQVVTRFPKLATDIQESSHCFACDRYGAAIFHVLLVAEFGVIEVAKLLEVPGDRPGWGCLERLERIANKNHQERSVVERQHSQFLENTLPLMLAIKDSWRHRISHVENKLVWADTAFSPQVAEEIISATRGFMRRLSVDLPKRAV